jgi:hypothetical protein
MRHIEQYLKTVKDWNKPTDAIVDSLLAIDYMDLKDRKEELKDAIERKKKGTNSRIVAEGGIKGSICLPAQDLLGLRSNDFDNAFGHNFLLASSDNWQTSSTYWILKNKEVIRLKTGQDGLVQLASPEILEDVLWPEFVAQKQRILDKLNSMCPFEQKGDGHMPFIPSEFAVTFQDCMSSWVLEHFNNIVVNYKYIPEENKEGVRMTYGKITEFTEVFAQHSKDKFVKEFNNNLPLLCGRYAQRINDHPLPYSYEADDYAFIKLDINNLIAEGPCPLWDQALSERLSSEEECAVFRAAVWQVYEVKNKSRQLVYLYDAHGRSGKSAMLRAAFSHLSRATQALQKQSLNNQFGFAKIWNKQLVTIGDNKNAKMLKSQIIHTATGGDLADVEYKGKDSFSACFKGHIWANGNVLLDIDTDAEHEVSRLVLFNIHKPESAKTILYQCDAEGKIMVGSDGKPLLGSGDPSWEEKLEAELPQFLYKCCQDYARYCPKHSDIILPQAMQDRIQEECAELNKLVFDDFLSTCIILGGSDSITDTQFRDVWNTWKEGNLERYEVPKTELSFQNLIEHMSKLGFKAQLKKLPNGKRLRAWPGVVLNEFTEKREKSGTCNEFEL